MDDPCPGQLSELELSELERESVDASLRQIEFLDSEIEAVERWIAADAIESAEVRRLMTVPGVNVIAAATFIAAIGEIGRFESPRKLVGYLGLDPRVRQSGSAPATHGRISKQGSGAARHALVEASWSTVSQPGLLTREEDYAFGQPSLTQKKLRLLEIKAGAPSRKGVRTGKWVAGNAMRDAERAAAEQAETAYRRTVADWHATQAKREKKQGAGATPGRASNGPSSGQAARQNEAPPSAL